MSKPLQFESLYGGQEVIVWSDCLLDLGCVHDQMCSLMFINVFALSTICLAVVISVLVLAGVVPLDEVSLFRLSGLRSASCEKDGGEERFASVALSMCILS